MVVVVVFVVLGSLSTNRLEILKLGPAKLRINARRLALTYSRCNVTIDELTSALAMLPCVKSFMLAQEVHHDADFAHLPLHYHVCLELKRKINSWTSAATFDIYGNHPHIRTFAEGASNILRWESYLLKTAATSPKLLTRCHNRELLANWRTFSRDQSNLNQFFNFHAKAATYAPATYPIQIPFYDPSSGLLLASITLNPVFHQIHRGPGVTLPAHWNQPTKRRNYLVVGHPDRGKSTSLRLGLTIDPFAAGSRQHSHFFVPTSPATATGRFDNYEQEDIVVYDDCPQPPMAELQALTAYGHTPTEIGARYSNKVSLSLSLSFFLSAPYFSFSSFLFFFFFFFFFFKALKAGQVRFIIIMTNIFPTYHADEWFTSRFTTILLDNIPPPGRAVIAPHAPVVQGQVVLPP